MTLCCRFYNNQVPNSISMHRVRGFRDFSRRQWLHHEEPYATGLNKIYTKFLSHTSMA